eukprot:751368-Hanusia_phi.AAC.1
MPSGETRRDTFKVGQPPPPSSSSSLAAYPLKRIQQLDLEVSLRPQARPVDDHESPSLHLGRDRRVLLIVPLVAPSSPRAGCQSASSCHTGQRVACRLHVGVAEERGLEGDERCWLELVAGVLAHGHLVHLQLLVAQEHGLIPDRVRFAPDLPRVCQEGEPGKHNGSADITCLVGIDRGCSIVTAAGIDDLGFSFYLLHRPLQALQLPERPSRDTIRAAQLLQ